MLKILLLYLLLTGASVVLMHTFGVSFGTEDFWQRHGVLFLVFIALFPRLTLLFSSVPFGGLLWWLGWLFTPRLLVSILATVTYWERHPILVIISWLVTLGGETGEKTVVVKRLRSDSREV